MHGLLALLAGAASWAGGVEIDATVDPETGRVSGVMRADVPIMLRDVLSELPLPMPRDDLVRSRTFPGRVDQGSITWEALEEEAQAWRFERDSVTHTVETPPGVRVDMVPCCRSRGA